MKGKITATFVLLAALLAIGATAVTAATAGHMKVTSNSSYIVQMVNSGGLWIFNLDPSGNLRRLDIPPGETKDHYVPGNTVANVWAYRQDKGDIYLGAAQIACFDLGGDLQITVTEDGKGKPAVAFSGNFNCWQVLTWPQ